MSTKTSPRTAWLILAFTTILCLLFNAQLLAEQHDPNKSEDLFEMSLEELMEVTIESTATLTETSPRLVPAAVTTITEEQIRASGARSLFELLDIYVPNLQWLRHHWEADVMGLRGIISDRNDKYLLLVNGRAINQRTHMGAINEQDLVLLADIHHIDVVRGPGSALYGPGAVSMVINIVTFNSDTFQGTEINARAGLVEQFESVEFKHGQPFKDNMGGVFLYAGIGDYEGANKYDAPMIYPFTFPSQSSRMDDPAFTGPPAGTFPNEGTRAGEPMTNMDVPNDGAAARGVPPIKLHAEIKREGWDIWVRYARGGKEFPLFTSTIARLEWGAADQTWYAWYDSNTGTYKRLVPNFYEYQQAIAYIGRQDELAENLDLDYSFSYSMMDEDKFVTNSVSETHREDQYNGKALLKWQPDDRHKIALGGEILHMELGMNSSGWPHMQSYSAWAFTGNPPMPRWSTNLYSLLGEYQWNINDRWTTFIGARLDDHTYTKGMFSPRASLIHTPTDRDTIKLMWSRSLRANFEENMKNQAMILAALSKDQNSKPEVLDSVEVRYERQHSKTLDLAASVYVHYNLEAIGWDQSQLTSTLAGTQREYGIELEADYHTEKARFVASHGYTKLYEFNLGADRMTYYPDPPSQGISAKPYGYENDLVNWSNHITKLTAQYKLDDQWTADASLRIYWGFPGMKDYDDYWPHGGAAKNRTYDPYTNYPIIEEGWERAYRGNYYLNLGLQYKHSKLLTVCLYAYNVLGIFEPDLNKRNYNETGGGGGTFRSHAPAIGIWAIYSFPSSVD